jgi:two-component system phosphate regulon sensor histidine kinase PhoR
MRWIVVFGGLLAAAAALGIGLFVTHRVTVPLTAMREVAVAIAAGDYRQRVEARSQDEIGLLSSAFNRMGAQLEDRMRTITEDRSKLLTILGGMVEGVVAVDRDRRVVHLNAAGGRILDVDPAASMKRPIWEVTRVRQVSQALDDAVAGSVEITREVQLEIGAQERIVQLHAAPLVNGHDDQVGAVLVMHDVTELRRLERIRRDFVANVSHELKTPITAIRGLIDTIVDDADMPVDVRSQFLGKIQNQSLRLSSLVMDLLTLARLESTDGMLETERVDLREVVGRSIGNFRANAEAKSVSLASVLPAGRVAVDGDAEALELLLNNLLDNAVKYTEDGGNVDVELRVEGTDAVLDVRDNGVGIGPEHHDRIFERFYRVDQARSRELGGTGLGLSIVKHITKAHRGAVTLESTYGAGSCFSVRLPLAQA